MNKVGALFPSPLVPLPVSVPCLFSFSFSHPQLQPLTSTTFMCFLIFHLLSLSLSLPLSLSLSLFLSLLSLSLCLSLPSLLLLRLGKEQTSKCVQTSLKECQGNFWLWWVYKSWYTKCTPGSKFSLTICPFEVHVAHCRWFHLHPHHCWSSSHLSSSIVCCHVFCEG